MLAELLGTLEDCEPPPDEVIVVDDASEVPAEQTLSGRTWPFRLEVLRNDEAQGPGAARNKGVHASRGDRILFTDDDCLVHPDWVGVLTEALADAEQEGLGGVGGRVRAEGDDLFSRYYDFHRILEPRPHDREHPERLPYLVTANCAVTRTAFMEAGGFDNRIPTAGGEDAAFSIRMVKRGYYLERCEDAVVRHRYRASLIDFARTFYRYGLGGRYVVDRYLPL
jgi:GT2 family glycosyltransferase